MSTETSGAVRVEQHGIDYIPPEARHGRPWTLLTFWGGSTVTVVAASVGGAPIFLGLSFWWTLVAILVGSVFGGIFMAYHSVQGPQLGVPQMLQTRAQFGYHGAILPILFVVAEYFGALVLAVIIGGNTVAGLTGLSTHVSMIITAAVLLGMTWVGYDLFHAFNRVVVVVSCLLFVVFAVKLVSVSSASSLSDGKLTAGVLILAITICASWQITYAPFVADYSRYLPVDTSSRAVFLYTYVGAVGGSSFAMIVGALGAATVKSFSGDTATAMGHLFPGLGGLVFFILFLGLLASNYEAPYGAYLCLMTIFSRVGRFGPVVRLRIIVTTLITVACTALAFAATSDVVSFINNYLTLILVALAPWTAINLTDFYFVRRGHYHTESLFKVDGIYGRVNVAALALYVISLCLEIPFLNIAWYEGPVAKVLGGGDISWAVGLAFSAPVYYFIARRQRAAPPQRDDLAPAPGEIETEMA